MFWVLQAVVVLPGCTSCVTSGWEVALVPEGSISVAQRNTHTAHIVHEQISVGDSFLPLIVFSVTWLVLGGCLPGALLFY